jgi:hypothetical protein
MDMLSYFLGRLANEEGGGNISTADLTIAPNFKGTAEIEPENSMFISVENLVDIIGTGTVGETLSIVSNSVDLDMCDFQWVDAVVKYSHTPNIDDNGV